MNDDPTPIHTLQRLRLIILGKSTNLQSIANTEHCSDSYIVGDINRMPKLSLKILRLPVYPTPLKIWNSRHLLPIT
jgi:hypothetical protein